MLCMMSPYPATAGTDTCSVVRFRGSALCSMSPACGNGAAASAPVSAVFWAARSWDDTEVPAGGSSWHSAHSEPLVSATRQTRPGGPRLPRPARRRQLLGAAQEGFVAHGHHAAAMGGIAAR